MAQGPINLSLFGSKVARGTPNRVLQFFFSIRLLRMRMRSVLVCLPHEQEQGKKNQNYRLSLVFITLTEELP